MSVNLPNRALVPSLSPLVVGVAPSSPPPPSLSPFFSNDRPFGGDTAARFLWCPTTLAGRAGRSGPDCNLGAGSGAADGRTEGVRVSEPFLRWAAVLDYVSSHFASGGRAILPSMHACPHFARSFRTAGSRTLSVLLSPHSENPLRRVSVGRRGRSVRRFRSPIPPPRTSWPCCMMDALAVVFDAEGPRRGGHMAKSYSKWAGCALTFQTSGWPAHSGSGPRSNQLDLTYICSTRTEDEIASISSTLSKPRVLLLSLQS